MVHAICATILNVQMLHLWFYWDEFPLGLHFFYSPVHPLYDVIQRFSSGERPFKLTWWPVISAGGPHSAPSACQRAGDEEKWSGKHEKRKEPRKCAWQSPAKPLWPRLPRTLMWLQKWTRGQQRSMLTTIPIPHIEVIMLPSHSSLFTYMTVQSRFWYRSLIWFLVLV